MSQNLEPEKEDGDTEYKRYLIDQSPEKISRLASQMRYRCDEGSGQCIYNIGVEDDGTIRGITSEECKMTMDCLEKVAKKNSYEVQIISKIPVNDEKQNDVFMYEVAVREKNEVGYVNLNVAIAGSVDCGKSSLLAVLITGKHDNGRGSARLNVFNYPHEVRSGRTSSVSQHILGFKTDGTIVNKDKNLWSDIVNKSTKIVSFIDLAGHEKYLKTTISGLSSSSPDLALIMVAANKGILPMSREHIILCVALKIPFAIVITKIDLVKDKVEINKNTNQSIRKILKSPVIQRIPIKVESDDELVRCALHIGTESITPVFRVSNVTGEGLDILRKFLHITCPKKIIQEYKPLNVELNIDHIWTVTGVGIVVGGQLVSGTISVQDKLLIGPYMNKYHNITVRSIHCKKVPLQKIHAGCYVCLSIKGVLKNEIHKGDVIMSHVDTQILCETFTANITVLRNHSTTIRIGYEPIMHHLSLRAPVRINDIKKKESARAGGDDDILQTGDTAILTIQIKGPKKYVKLGSRVLLCESRTKLSGIVTSIN